MLDVTTKTLLEVDEVCQSYSAGTLVLDHVSMRLEQNEIVALLGRSGCGKSSLLRIVAGLAQPASGAVKYRGATVTGPFDGVAMVFQSFALFPWLSVLDRRRNRIEGARRGAEQETPARLGRHRRYRP